MKILYLLAFILLASMAYGAKEHDYEELVAELRKPAVEVVVAQLMGHLNRDKLVPLIGGHGYDVVRTGVGCAAGVFGGLDQGFTILDIVRRNPTDWQRWIFAGIFVFAWWQQNGQYLGYVCGTFWELLHS